MHIPYIDIHTHHPVNSGEIISIPSLFLQEAESDPDIPFSAAIHPWHADNFEHDEVRSMLEILSAEPNFIAVGETGLDKVCTADYTQQKEVFEIQLRFAETHRKPMIIHVVKSWNDLIPYLRDAKVPCILHGYSEGDILTKQLVEMGCFFSFGSSIMSASPRIAEAVKQIPVTSLFFETDDSEIAIADIYGKVAGILNIPLEQLKVQVHDNFQAVFGRDLSR